MGGVYRDLSKESCADIASRILYEDNHLLVFNKRPGEIVQSDLSGDESLEETLKSYIAHRDNKPGAVFLGVPHRLDRPVGGALLLAKTSKALERLNRAFREGEVHKTYWALSCARPPKEEDTLVHYIVRNERINKSFVSGTPKKNSKEARLHYKLIRTTDRYFLLEVELYTGRHHQIRSQLASIGCVIKGDLKYGAPRSNPDGSISLHAKYLSFVHPVRKEKIDIDAPVLSESFLRCIGS